MTGGGRGYCVLPWDGGGRRGFEGGRRGGRGLLAQRGWRNQSALRGDVSVDLSLEVERLTERVERLSDQLLHLAQAYSQAGVGLSRDVWRRPSPLRRAIHRDAPAVPCTISMTRSAVCSTVRCVESIAGYGSAS